LQTVRNQESTFQAQHEGLKAGKMLEKRTKTGKKALEKRTSGGDVPS
jgi:hypothetical protein